VSTVSARETVLIAAMQVFGERGYDAATTDAIASRAGYSQAHVIQTFGGKHALFLEAVDRATDEIVRRCEAVPAGDGSLPVLHEALARGFRVLAHLFVRDDLRSCARAVFLRVYVALRDRAALAPETAVTLIGNALTSSIIARWSPE
jgi:TetR/AcrR family transcriptional regulator